MITDGTPEWARDEKVPKNTVALLQLKNDLELNSQCINLFESIIYSIIGNLNDARTRLYVSKMLNEVLTYFHPSYELWVVCDKSNNPPETVDENKFVIFFFKKTNYSAEYKFRSLEIGPNMNFKIG